MNSQIGMSFNSTGPSSASSQALSSDFLSMITTNTRSQSTSTQRQDDDLTHSMAQNYSVLTRCWRYERGSTLLLPYLAEFFIPIRDYIDKIEGLLLDRRIQNEVQVGLLELEIERLRYMYNDVHRIRLRKIELNPMYYAYDKFGKTKLSPAELEFAKGYAKLITTTMKEGLGDLPGQLGREAVMFESPATDHVALLHYLPKQPDERTLDIPNQSRALYPNTVIIVPYEECQEWIKNGEFDVL